MRYDFVDLRLFLQVVAEGSITAGARRMHLSLPSASARVRALEGHAGVELLVRGRRGVRPTPAGMALVRHARDVLADAARLESAIASYSRAAAAPLILVAGSSAMHRLVPRALISFLLTHPDLDVTVSEHPSAVSVQMLADGRAHLGVVLDDIARESGLECQPLGDDSLVVIGRAEGVLSERSALSYRDVAEHPMVGLEAGSPLQASIATHAGPHAPAVRYRTVAADLGTVVALAAAGVGLAIVPRRAVDPDQPLDVCALLDAWSNRGLSLCWGATTPRPPGVTALADHLVRAAGGAQRPAG